MRENLLIVLAVVAVAVAVAAIGFSIQMSVVTASLSGEVKTLREAVARMERSPAFAEDVPRLNDLDRRLTAAVGRVAALETKTKP